MPQSAMWRLRSALARCAADPGLVTLHAARGLVEFAEATLGNVATMLSPARVRRELKRRDQERSRGDGRWFVPEESALVEVLARLIVPSDETGPGADQMGLVGPSATETIDDLVKRSPSRHTLYPRGLLTLDRIATEKHKSRFLELSHGDQLRLLQFVDRLHQTWSRPVSLTTKVKNRIGILYRKWSGEFPSVALWPVLVHDVMQAFYAHRVSWTWLDYDGPPLPEGYPELERRAQGPETGILS